METRMPCGLGMNIRNRTDNTESILMMFCNFENYPLDTLKAPSLKINANIKTHSKIFRVLIIEWRG